MNATLSPDIFRELATLQRAIDSLAEQVRLSRIPISPIMTPEEAGKMLGCSQRTVRRLVDRGDLQSVRIPSARGQGTLLRIQASDLQGFIDRQRTVPATTRAKSDDQMKKSLRKVRVPLIDL
jgi:excisionase family DNA binding protein